MILNTWGREVVNKKYYAHFIDKEKEVMRVRYTKQRYSNLKNKIFWKSNYYFHLLEKFIYNYLFSTNQQY